MIDTAKSPLSLLSAELRQRAREAINARRPHDAEHAAALLATAERAALHARAGRNNVALAALLELEGLVSPELLDAAGADVLRAVLEVAT